MLTAEQCQAESINVTLPEENRLEGGLGKAITLRRTELNLKRREFAERAHLSYPTSVRSKTGSRSHRLRPYARLPRRWDGPWLTWRT